jgi:hypothetical protein
MQQTISLIDVFTFFSHAFLKKKTPQDHQVIKAQPLSDQEAYQKSSSHQLDVTTCFLKKK